MKGKRPFEHSSHELACVCIGRGGFFFKKRRKGEHGAEREREARFERIAYPPSPAITVMALQKRKRIKMKISSCLLNRRQRKEEEEMNHWFVMCQPAGYSSDFFFLLEMKKRSFMRFLSFPLFPFSPLT